MSDFGTVGQGGLPDQPPRPVLAALPAVPPPLPTMGPALTAGPFHQPPVFFRTEDPKPAGEPQWVMWGMFAFIALMIGAGLIAVVATRAGPSRAAARVTPAPTPAWKTGPVVAPPAVRPNPTARVAPAVPAPVVPTPVAPARVRKPPVAVTNFPLVALPNVNEADLQLKKLWQNGQTVGATVRTMRTLKTLRGPDAMVTPIQVELGCAMAQAVEFIQGVPLLIPTAVVDSVELTDPNPGANDGAGPGAVKAVIVVDMYFAGEGADAAVPFAPAADVTGTLIDAANALPARMRFTRVAVNVAGATAATQSALRTMLTLEGLAPGDMEVADYMVRLNRSGRFRDVNLVSTDASEVDGQVYRKFILQMQGKGSGAPRPAAGEATDLFRPARPTTPPKPPAPPELPPGEAQRRVEQLELESVVTGKQPACVINGRLYRVGHVVNGLTIERITAEGVVVRAGGQRFEVKPRRP